MRAPIINQVHSSVTHSDHSPSVTAMSYMVTFSVNANHVIALWCELAGSRLAVAE